MSRQAHHPMTDELLVRCLAGEASEAERVQITHWLDASEANSHYFKTFKWAMSCSRPDVTTGHISEEEEWQAFRDKVHTSGIPTTSLDPTASSHPAAPFAS